MWLIKSLETMGFTNVSEAWYILPRSATAQLQLSFSFAVLRLVLFLHNPATTQLHPQPSLLANGGSFFVLF